MRVSQPARKTQPIKMNTIVNETQPLQFTSATLWYDGPEGRFLCRSHRLKDKSLASLIPLSKAQLDAIETLATINESNQTVLQSLIDERWLHRPSISDVQNKRWSIALNNVQSLYQAAYKPNLSATDYHLDEMEEAFNQFDNVEITCSHSLREPNDFFAGRSYGEAFADWLRPKLQNGARVLEVGGGTGILAKRLLTHLKDLNLRYYLLDLSPQMQRSQREQCVEFDNIQFLTGNALDYDFGDMQFDFILSNEVIADFDTDIAERSKLEAGKADSEAERLVLQYNLDISKAPPKFCINTGAIAFVERIAKLLLPNGQAWLSEYGSQQFLPMALDLDGHREHSIHFGHLSQVATAVGLIPKLSTAGHDLNVQGDILTASYDQTRILSDVLAPKLGINMPKLTHSKRELKAVWQERYKNIGGLQFSPLANHRDIFNPYIFISLHMQKT